jgi:hypothetical protein
LGCQCGLFCGKAQPDGFQSVKAVSVQGLFAADSSAHAGNLLLQFKDFAGRTSAVDLPRFAGRG